MSLDPDILPLSRGHIEKMVKKIQELAVGAAASLYVADK